MYDAYQNALRTIADSYEAEVALYGGRSLSRVATIVVSSGAFFQRLREGKPFLVHNLERLAAWFRDASNWPNGDIPNDAAVALTSMGRPPIADIASDTCVKRSAAVECDTAPISHRSDRA